MGLARRLRSVPGRLLAGLVGCLPQGKLETLIKELILRRAASLPPGDALRFLFRLDAALYPLVGRYAVDFGGGVHTKHRHTRYHEFFIKRCRPGDRVLDVGCGGGELAFDIATQAGSTVTGLDMDAERISSAERKFTHANLEWRVGDILEGVVDKGFDVVVLSNVLEHLPDRAELLGRLQEVTGASRYLVRVPLFERDWRVPLKEELGVEWRLDPTHQIEYTLETFAREMTLGGLTIIHQEVRWGEIWAELEPSKTP